MTDLPIQPVYLNHLEAMGLALALMAEEQRSGLTGPQRDAYEKIQLALAVLLKDLWVE